MTKVLIVDDHRIISNAVAILLRDNFSEIEVLQESNFQMGKDILKKESNIELIILGINVPGGKSLLMMDELRMTQKKLGILIFSGISEERHAIEFLNAGADGFLSKSCEEHDLIVAVRLLLNHDKYVSLAVQKQIMDNFFEKKSKLPDKILNCKDLITPRENDILQLLLKGKWTKEIAHELRLKLSTVSSHKTRIFEKLEVNNIIDLFKKIEKSSGNNQD